MEIHIRNVDFPLTRIGFANVIVSYADRMVCISKTTFFHFTGIHFCIYGQVSYIVYHHRHINHKQVRKRKIETEKEERERNREITVEKGKKTGSSGLIHRL